MSDSSKFGEIYRELWRHCPAYGWPAPWDHLEEASDLCSLPVDPAATLSALRQRFSDDDLLEAGAAVRGSDGQIALAPGLCDPSTMVFAFRAGPKVPPFDLLVAAGCLSSACPPVCATLADGRLRKMARVCGEILCIAGSMADAAVLIKGGVAATPATGLATLRDDRLEVFCRVFQLTGRRGRERAGHGRSSDQPDATPPTAADPPPARAETTASLVAQIIDDPNFEPPDLVLADWSPSQLSLAQPEELGRVVSHFSGIHEYLEIDLDLSLWRPSGHDLERIQFCLEEGRRRHVQRALLASIDGSSVPMIAPPDRASPGELVSARNQLQEALGSRHSQAAEARSQAWRDYQRLLQQQLANPLAEQASAADDPVQRNYTLAAADIAQLVHAQTMAMTAKISDQIRDASGCATPLSATDVKQLVAMTDRFITLAREIDQCRRRFTGRKRT